MPRLASGIVLVVVLAAQAGAQIVVSATVVTGSVRDYTAWFACVVS